MKWKRSRGSETCGTLTSRLPHRERIVRQLRVWSVVAGTDWQQRYESPTTCDMTKEIQQAMQQKNAWLPPQGVTVTQLEVDQSLPFRQV